MGSNKGRAWVSMGGVGHVELSEGFFGLTLLGDKLECFSKLGHGGPFPQKGIKV